MKRGTLIAAIVLVYSLLGGCGATTKITGQQNHAALTKEVKQPDGTVTTTHEEVTTTGANGESRGTAEVVKVEASSPPIKTPGGFEIGASNMNASGTASAAHSAAGRWTAGTIGTILLLGGLCALYLRQPLKASIGTALLGAALIACAVLVDLAEYILAGAAVAGAIALWLTGFDAAKFRESARAIRAGMADILKTDPNGHRALTERIAAHATGSDLKTLAAIDHKDELKN